MFSKIKIDYPSGIEIERTKQSFILFFFKNGEELTKIFIKSDVLILSYVFEKFLTGSISDFNFNPMYYVFPPGFSRQCGLKYTNINLQTLQDKDMVLLSEKTIRGGLSIVMGDRYVKAEENKRTLYIDANKLYDPAMSEHLPYDESIFNKIVKIEGILNTSGDSRLVNSLNLNSFIQII